MAESGIILPPDSSGKANRTETVTTTFTGGSDTLAHMPVEVVGDANNSANLLKVNGDGSLNVSEPDIFQEILIELKAIRLLIALMSDNDVPDYRGGL